MLKFVCFILIVVGACAIRPSVNVPGSGDRVVGGQHAKAGQFPYHVSIQLRDFYDLCGGAIIGPWFILTTAFCTRYGIEYSSAYVGSQTTENGTRYRFERIIKHPNYKEDTRENDIAVIRTVLRIKFIDLVQPIALPTTAAQDKLRVIFTGWELDLGPDSEKRVSILMFKRASVMAAVDECRGALPDQKIHENYICTRLENGTGSCLGDFGGPLATESVPRKLIGIQIRGFCGLKSTEMYNDVFKHLAFIRGAMK